MRFRPMRIVPCGSVPCGQSHGVPTASRHTHTHAPSSPPPLQHTHTCISEMRTFPTAVNAQFHKMREASNGQNPLLTQEQQNWLKMQNLIAATSLEVSLGQHCSLC